MSGTAIFRIWHAIHGRGILPKNEVGETELDWLLEVDGALPRAFIFDFVGYLFL